MNRWAWAAVVAGAVAAVFLPSLKDGFVGLDDGHYLGQLSRPDFLAWAVTTTENNIWMPLTWLSLWTDRALLGPEPWIAHLVNLVLHAGNAALLFALAVRLWPVTRLALPCAAFAAVLFGIHPLRVESVAWVTERKDVLAGLLALLATHAWLSWTTTRRRRWYVASVAAFALACTSKPTVVPLPVVWLGIDLLRGRRALLEKVPHLALSAGTSWMTLVAARGVAATMPQPAGFLVGSHAAARYLWATLVPVGLHPARTHQPNAVIWSGTYVLAAVVVGAISAACVRLWRRLPAAGVTWGSYLLLVLPASGAITRSGMIGEADRYSYLASMALSLGVGAACAALLEARPGAARAAMAAAGVAAVTLATLSVRQIASWRDTESLWVHVLSVDPDNWMALREHMRHAHDARRWDEALAFADRLLANLPRWEVAGELDLPQENEPRRMRAFCFVQLGRLQEAADELRTILARFPDDRQARRGYSEVLRLLSLQAQPARAAAHP